MGYTRHVSGQRFKADHINELQVGIEQLGYNVVQAGADPTGATLSTTALQDLIDDVPTGSTLWFPDGFYKFTNLSITKALTFAANGWYSLMRDPFGTAAYTSMNPNFYGGAVLLSTATTGAALEFNDFWGNFHLRNLMVIGPGSGTSTGIKIGTAANAALQCHIENVLVANFALGWDLTNLNECTFLAPRAMGCSTGFRMQEAFNQNVLHNIEVQHSTADGILLLTGGNAVNCNKFVGGLLQNISGRSGLRVEASCDMNTFEGFYCENGTSATNMLDFAGGGETVFKEAWLSSNCGTVNIASARMTFGPIRSGATPAVTIAPGTNYTKIIGSDQIVLTDNGFGTIWLQAPGLQLGTGGTPILHHTSVTATLDFPSIPAHSTAQLTIAMPTGSCAAGDDCSVTPLGAIEVGLVWSGRVSATDTVMVRLANVTAGAIDPASRTWRASVWKH